MYISQITIKNYRSFAHKTIFFNSGLNVIIGHNNAGKTNFLRALQLVIDADQSKPGIDDFNSAITDFSHPPEITISMFLRESEEIPGQPKGEHEEDKNVIYDWLISETKPYCACLTYSFLLPFKHLTDYHKEIATFKNPDDTYDILKCRKLIAKKYIHKYTASIFGGDPRREEKASRDNLERIDFQFLDAIRDAEKQMFSGGNTLLRDVLSYFLDYDLTAGQDFEKLDEQQRAELKRREGEFTLKSNDLLSHLIGRISKNEILAYSASTGADKGGIPNFDADISEQQLLFALRLIVEKSGCKLPIKNNGLGYNNLLFIALILAKMQMERSSFMGDNAKIFPVLAIEEPEAHLHPSMQYKFLKFLENNLHGQKQARQAFITTHSTQITSAVSLESIICLYEDFDGHQRVSYPGRVFSQDPKDQESRAYIMRFLDATKSNMLFADKIILVEGIAEQLLLPCMAAYLDKETDLIDSYTAIISVDSISFKHFLKMFAFKDEEGNYGLRRKIVCLTDADPAQKLLAEDETHRQAWKSCYPFQLDSLPDEYHYRPIASHALNLIEFSKDYPHIKISTPISGTGKTLEYELALHNPNCELLLTGSFPVKGKNKKSLLKSMMDVVGAKNDLEALLSICEHEDIKNWITSSKWDEQKKAVALFAACYHRAIESSKGEHAFLLEQQLRENLLLQSNKRLIFSVPQYITDSLTFLLPDK